MEKNGHPQWKLHIFDGFKFASLDRTSFLALNSSSPKSNRMLAFFSRGSKFESCKDNKLSSWLFKFFTQTFYYTLLMHKKQSKYHLIFNFRSFGASILHCNPPLFYLLKTSLLPLVRNSKFICRSWFLRFCKCWCMTQAVNDKWLENCWLPFRGLFLMHFVDPAMFSFGFWSLCNTRNFDHWFW